MLPSFHVNFKISINNMWYQEKGLLTPSKFLCSWHRNVQTIEVSFGMFSNNLLVHFLGIGFFSNWGVNKYLAYLVLFSCQLKKKYIISQYSCRNSDLDIKSTVLMQIFGCLGWLWEMLITLIRVFIWYLYSGGSRCCFRFYKTVFLFFNHIIL